MLLYALGLGNLLSFRIFSKGVKIQLYLTIVRPIVMCGSQCRTLRKTEEDPDYICVRDESTTQSI